MDSRTFDRFSHAVGHAAGQPLAFILCVILVLAWAVSGPIFGFSESWQLVINTGTTIVTFLMVFILQNSQNRDGLAVQAKLDELIRASKAAENRFIGAEQLTEHELNELRQLCAERAHLRKTTGMAPDPVIQMDENTAVP